MIKLEVSVSGESFTKIFRSRGELLYFVEENAERSEDPGEECRDYDPFKGSCGVCRGCKAVEKRGADEDDADAW